MFLKPGSQLLRICFTTCTVQILFDENTNEWITAFFREFSERKVTFIFVK